MVTVRNFEVVAEIFEVVRMFGCPIGVTTKLPVFGM
jgi:hypothetical protein